MQSHGALTVVASAGDWGFLFVFFGAMLCIVGLFVWWSVRHGFHFVQVGFLYDEPPEEALRDWIGYYAAWLAGHGYAMTSNGFNTVTYQRRYVPRWAVVIAVLFFPIGLLALLARSTANLVVSAGEEPSGTYVGVSGDVPRLVAESLRRDASELRAAEVDVG
jgi:hypothetical protein